jgi:ABC-type multidrug transport system ATPase subunit/ABC-type multidrug transport system permease subunit
MSQSVIEALMQLFAIVADVEGLNDKSKTTVQHFLEQEVGPAQVGQYLKIYDDFIQQHHYRKAKKDGRVKQTSRNAVKILRIAAEINKILTRQQKLIVLIRLLEYIYGQHIVSDQNLEFLQAIVDAFNIDSQEFNNLQVLISSETVSESLADEFVVASSIATAQKSLPHFGLNAPLVFLNLKSSKVLVVKSFGNQELYLNGVGVQKDKVYLLHPGSSIRSSKISPIYYSDVLGHFTSDTELDPVIFSAEDITYEFANKKLGLQPMNFQVNSGQMVGIMGGSGTGKSTLLNVLNGNYTPSTGSVNINGRSIHNHSKSVEGLIGYVPQDDLLIEDLTVFQNLLFNARLSFGNLSQKETELRVNDVLKVLGLEETRDLKVGGVLEKTISGGQRKRINIALELMREPAVLFVDEPTSGLSSRDSENIMDLLKELTLKGKLIFVVIHQPSSDIFKLFDKLLILDKGGYLIYQGNPLDSVSYFRLASGLITDEGGDCSSCGNVNPEQVFGIIESRLVNEYGDLTEVRKRTPKDWSELFATSHSELSKKENPESIPKAGLSIPSWFKQFKVFVQRDVLSKLSNQQYLLINLLEAPVLALIITGFLRYKPHGANEYIFRNNENVLSYLFISVVVALFLGLSVSAEEIIRDRKIRKREAFLNLSKSGYLFSKVVIQFAISAIQIFTYVSLGNYVLGIEGMTGTYWLILFSAAAFANVLGLNISASFRNVVTIYILIPFIIIPQILFSGVLVKYSDLNPWFAAKKGVPVIGNIMTSRWAFEALAVEQATNNVFERHYFEVNQELYHYSFMRNYWIPEVRASLSAISSSIRKQEPLANRVSLAHLVYAELNELPQKELKHFKGNWEHWESGQVVKSDVQTVNDFVHIIDDYYNRMIKKYTQEKDRITGTLRESLGGDKAYWAYKAKYENEHLWEFVNNKNNLSKIVETSTELIRNENLSYLRPKEGVHHYYAPVKFVFGHEISTFWYNIMVIWIATISLMLVLYGDGLKRMILLMGKLRPN